jgi:hypothetical protein
MNEDLLRQVSDLIMKDADFRLLSQRKDVYCPFEALGAARTEIRHSNFLSNLITPNAAHGFGDSLLKSFLEALLSQANAPELLLQLHLSDLSNAIVMREWKHIDILIRVPRGPSKQDLIFAVEIKVESGEHGNQLENYETAVNDAWPSAKAFFFFLTPDHTQSSRQSWVDVPFSSLLEEFERALSTGEGHLDARRMAESYISMMRRRYVADEQLIDLAAQIWGQHRSALEFLIEYQPNAANELLQAVLDSELLEKLSRETQSPECNLTFVIDTNSARHLRLAVKEWDDAKGMLTSSGWVASGRMLLLEAEFHTGGVHARWVVGRGPQEHRVAFIAALDPNRQRRVTSDWTRIGTRPLLSRKEMSNVIDEGVDTKVVSKVIAGLVNYAADTGKDFDRALKAARLL